MFKKEDIESIDRKYFTVIVANEYDITLVSNNTHHVWYIHNVELPDEPEIGTAIDNAMIAIEEENKKLKGILPKNFARPELDKRRLGDVVDLFTNVQMADGSDEKDLLGRTYEYCLRNFAEQEGKNAGQFYTPSCVVRTIVGTVSI